MHILKRATLCKADAAISSITMWESFFLVFDGHGGPDAEAYIKRHGIKFFFEDAELPQASEADVVFMDSLEKSVRKAFLHADSALADDCTVSSSSGTTALATLIFGSGSCHKGEDVDISKDHRPIYVSEQQRVKECDGHVDDDYLNGLLFTA